MLLHTLLTAALAAPLSSQPPAPPAQPQQQPATPLRRDQLLTAQLKSELKQPLTDMGWPAEDQEFFTTRVLPCLFRPRLKVVLSPEDQARFGRLKRRAVFNADLKRNIPIRDDELVVSWVMTARNYATLRGPAPKGFYRSLGIATDLKPGLLRLWLSTRTGTPLPLDAGAKQIADDLAAALALPELAGDRAHLVAYVLSGTRSEVDDYTTLARAAQLYAARPDADRWFADYFTGIAEIELAWRERGAKLAAHTTDAQFRAFFAHLAKADAALTRAHAARPGWAEAAQDLIIVAMGQENGAAHTPLYWYEQATKADPSDPRAAAALAYAGTGKWAGDAGKPWIKRVTDDAAALQDFTSPVPMLAATVLLDRSAELKGELGGGADDAIKAPGVYERLRAVFTGYLTARDPAITPDTARSWLLFLARSAEKPAEATQLLDTPGFTPLPLNLPIARAPVAIRWWAALAQSPHGDAIAAADKALLRGDTDAALSAFQDIAAKSPNGDAAAIVNARVGMITRVRQAGAQGQAIQPLLLENAAPGAAQTPMCMQTVSNGWSGRIEPVTTPQGPSAAICFTPTHEVSGTRFVLPAPLDAFKQGIELTFDVQLTAASLVVHLNHAAPQSGNEMFGPSLRINADGARFDNAHSENSPLKGSAKKANHRIRILISGWKAEAWCDQELADWSLGPGTFDRNHSPDGWLSFEDGGGDGSVRVENLTIAPLKEPLIDRPKRERGRQPGGTSKPQDPSNTPAKPTE